MYKKIILSFLLIVFLFGCAFPSQNSSIKPKEKERKDFVKAVWVTYYELSSMTVNSDEDEFKDSITEMFKSLSDKGFTRVSIQVRPFSDAFYISDYFPISSYCFGRQGSDPLYDPLKIMCDAAKKYKLELEAWVNPYRVSFDSDLEKLSSDNPALSFKDTENLIITDKGVFFNPASTEVQELIVNGVREIVENYDVASVCFDDYFYPSTDEDIDKGLYSDYAENGGELSLSDWRRENVNSLIKSVYNAIKEADGDVLFGISPASNINNNYNNLYADTILWATEKGYVDYINPQIYFGFQNENQPFMKTAKQWSKMTECDLYVSLPLYKTGLEDEYAGDRGENEFIENNNIISRQYTYLTKLDGVDGVYIFSYSFLNDCDEAENLYSAMQISSK